MKDKRQKAILEIIAEKDIETQYELIAQLNARGFSSTQATVSRDIRELRLVKELTPGGAYRYAVPTGGDKEHDGRLRAIFRECVTSCVAAQNLVVIKTLPGLAPAAMSAIDKMELDGVAGTIAGDDTAFIAMMDSEAARRLCRMIQEEL